MAVKIDKTIRMSGVVINSKQGIVKLNRPLGDSDVYKSMTLTKYADSDLVELVFRISSAGGNTSRQLVRVTKLEQFDRFWISLMSIEGLDADEATNSIMTELGFEEDAYQTLFDTVTELLAGKIPNIKLVEGLAYDEAWDMQDKLQETFAGKMGFDVVKHTTKDLPANISATANALVQQLEWVENFWIAPQLRPLFEVARHTVAEGGFMNVLIKGESGYGKTSNFKALASWLGIPCYYINCAILMDNEQWFGYPEARDGSTLFQPSDFTKALQEGHCVIILDEINRVEPWMHNALLPILDYRRETIVHNELVKCAPGIIFAATMNDGFRYAGTNTMDAAVINRFPFSAVVSAPPAAVEAAILERKFPQMVKTDINRLISLMNSLRRNQTEFSLSIDVSTRSAENIAELCRKGLTMRQAFQYVLVNSAEISEQKGILDTINSALGVDPLFS